MTGGSEFAAMTYVENHTFGDVMMAVLAWTVCIATGIIALTWVLNI